MVVDWWGGMWSIGGMVDWWGGKWLIGVAWDWCDWRGGG